MFRFSLTRDITIYTLIYAAAVPIMLYWVFRSSQADVARTRGVALGIVIRMTLVFAMLFGLCAGFGIAAWIPFALVFLFSNPSLGLLVIPILYPIQQFVLGAPVRAEWFLRAPRPSAAGSTVDPLHVLLEKRERSYRR